MKRKKKLAANRKEAEWKSIIGVSTNDDEVRTPAQKAALQRIGVTEAVLASVPRITPLLRRADGGLKTVLAAMRLAAGDETISAFLCRYDSIPKADRACLPFEAVAVAAGINVNALLGATLLALERQAISLVKILCVTSHPRITAARIRFGQMPGGSRDRQALDQALGLLPSPKGPTFIGKAIFGSGQNTMQQQKQLQRRYDEDDLDDEGNEEEVPIVENDIDLDKLFPPANIMQERLVAIRQRTLPPPDVPSKTPASLWNLPKRDA